MLLRSSDCCGLEVSGSLPTSLAMANNAARLARVGYSAPRRWWPHFYTSLFCIVLLVYALSNYSASLHLFYHLVSRNESIPFIPQCTSDPRDRPQSLRKLPEGETYLFYAPHSGFSNQVGELKNALLIAALLNRTLILPPVFDHHAVALGSCPKYRVQEPDQMRALAWSHISDLIRSGRYIAIADIVDISAAVSSSLVKTIDLRIFSSIWCGVDVTSACSGPLCSSLATSVSTWGTLESCGALLSRPDALYGGCVYGVKDDCRTTIWMHGLESSSFLDSNRMPHQSQAAWQILNQAVVKQKKRTAYKRMHRDIVEALGPGSKAARAKVLSFGSLFSAEYKGTQLHVEIRPPFKDSKIRALFEAIHFLPFTPDVVNAGKLYSRHKIRRPFFCAQLRLLDGQFKNHWEKTFAGLKVQLQRIQKQQGPSEVLHLFLMTDLPPSNWTGTYLGELSTNTSLYKVHLLEDKGEFILDAAQKLMTKEYGLQSGFLPRASSRSGQVVGQDSKYIPDILLYVQEVICSCASLGFVGTSGSTIADNILQLRNANTCTSTNVSNQ